MRASVRLIWITGVKHLVAHRTRLVLSAVGIAAGVALGVAVSAIGSSIDASLSAVANAAASEADLEVRGRTTEGLPAEALESVGGAQGVEAVGATVEAYTLLRSGPTTERALVLGVDRGIFEMAPQAVDPASFEAADPFGLMLPQSVADDLRVTAGDEIEVSTPAGWRPVTVGAVLDGDIGRGRVAVGVIGVVQDLLGKSGRVDAIYVQTTGEPGALAAVQRAVGDAGRVGPTALRQEDIQEFLAPTMAALNTAAIIALFVGAFLVYNTMSMAAVERMHEASLLRAVGALRRQVFVLFIAEGGLLGLVGTATGLAGGILMARVMLIRRGGSLEEIFPIEISTLSLDSTALIFASVLGIVAAIGAAYLPARRISRADPTAALGPAGTFEDPIGSRRRLSATIGSVLFFGGAGATLADLFIRGKPSPTAMAGLTVAMAGLALLIPVVIPFLARRVLTPLLTRGARTPGLVRLAVGEILRSPGRTAFTAGAVLLALSLVTGFSIAMASFSATFRIGMDRILGADLFVRSATWRPLGSDVPLDASHIDRVKAIPGVHTAYPFRVISARVNDELVLIQSIDYAAYAELPDLPDDFAQEMRVLARDLSRPDTVAISPSVATQLGIDVGETIELPTPTGVRTMRVEGVFPDPSAVTPTLMIDHRQLVRHWGTATADSFGVGVAPGTDPDEVQAAITAQLGEELGVVVDTQRQFRERINGFVSSILSLVASVQFVAVLVAGLGLANTLLISTLERRRDLGVLRAIGMLRRQVRRMVTLEALIVGGLGVVLAWGLGTFIGLFMQRFMAVQAGMDIRLVLPWLGYAVPAVLGIFGAALAALYPAHRASRIDVVDALQYE